MRRIVRYFSLLKFGRDIQSRLLKHSVPFSLEVYVTPGEAHTRIKCVHDSFAIYLFPYF